MQLRNKILLVIFGLLLLNLCREYIFGKEQRPPSVLNSSYGVNFDIKKEKWDYYGSVFENIKPIRLSLPLILKGTIISDPNKSFAIIEDLANKSQDLYRLGDMVSGAKIVAMNRNNVTLDFNGAKQELVMSEATPRACPEVGQARGVASDLGVDFAKILTQLRLKPYFEGGKCRGFQIDNINNNFIKQMGLKDGDVIESINGIKVNDPLKALQMIYNLEKGNPVHLGIERRDEKVELECRLKDENI